MFYEFDNIMKLLDSLLGVAAERNPYLILRGTECHHRSPRGCEWELLARLESHNLQACAAG